MRLVRRLTFVLLAAVATVFAADAVLSMRSMVGLFERDLRRDERLLGGALGQAVEIAWDERGESHAREVVRQANARQPGSDIRVVFVESSPGSSEAPSASDLARGAVDSGRSMTDWRRDAKGENRLYTYVPLSLPGDRRAALEVSEALDEELEYLRGRVLGMFLTAGCMVLICGAVAWVLGVRFVGRPVAKLVEKARRIGSGDFSAPLTLGGNHELSQLAKEMNGMAASLDAAARKVAVESAARIAALGQLRHADRLTTVGKLAAGIAHELGTPLNVVSGRAGMILSGEATGPQDLKSAAAAIVEQTARMTRIVRQLLEFARRRGPEKRVAELAPLVQQTVAMLDPLAAGRGVRLECSLSEPFVAAVDPSQLQQALTNLIVNAIQASSEGGCVQVQLHGHDARPAGAPARLQEDWAELRVTDGGIGIPPEQLSAIFDPFFTTKPVGAGTGLGLSVAYGIIEEHGGWIGVRSAVGRGSTFSIWLPREVSRNERPHPDRG